MQKFDKSVSVYITPCSRLPVKVLFSQHPTKAHVFLSSAQCTSTNASIITETTFNLTETIQSYLNIYHLTIGAAHRTKCDSVWGMDVSSIARILAYLHQSWQNNLRNIYWPFDSHRVANKQHRRTDANIFIPI